ncbi:MAG: thioredoxin-disulfide reductase [Elusimicrobiota bacterium]
MADKLYDVIIIGGGPAGLTAGLYAARARLNTLLIDNYGIDSQVVSADIIENYPGFVDGIKGVELLQKLKLQSVKFGLQMLSDEVESVTETNQHFEIKTTTKSYSTCALIIATGGKPKQLGISGENELKGRGVSYCATCDGALFRNKTVAVVGGGDTAIEEALFLTKFADKVFVIHRRDKLRATKILQERALSNIKIAFVLNSKVVEIKGSGVGGIQKVESVVIENVQSAQKSSINCAGVFIFAGFTPNTEFLKKREREGGEGGDIAVQMDDFGYIITDAEMKTSNPAIFACGDCRAKPLRQVVTACSDGAIAAISCEKYIESIRLKEKG